MASFTGTASDEFITPDFVSPTVAATGGKRPSNAADTINAGGGNDFIESGGGNDVVIGGPGNDTAILGSGNDTFIWNPGDGSDVVEGGSGTDTLVFNGSNANENMTLSANGSRTRLFRDVGNVTMDLNSMERIDINALGGADNITIDDLAGTGVKQVAIDLSAPAGSGTGDGSQDTVTVNGTAGNDHITVSTSGNSATVLGLAARVTVTGAELANDRLVIDGLGGNDTLTFAGARGGAEIDVFLDGTHVGVNQVGSTVVTDLVNVENLVVNGTSGDDIIRAGNGLAQLTSLTINGGAGNDTIFGGDGADLLNGGDGNDSVTGGRGNDIALLGSGDDTFVWNPGDGSDIVEGQGGFDTLLFNGANVNERVTISANGSRVRFFRDVGNVTMDLNSIERIEFNALGGADTITVDGLAGTGTNRSRLICRARPAAAPATAQSDTVIVNGTAGNDHITIANDGASIVVNGLATQVTIAGAEAGAVTDTLVINALDGNNTVDASALATRVNLSITTGAGNDVITGSGGNDVIDAGAGDDVVTGGPGTDIAFLGAGDDRFIWNPGDGSDSIDGQDGTDTLVFNGSDANETFVLSANGSAAQLFRDVGNVTMTLNEMEAINLATGDGSDTVVVNDMTGTGITKVAIDLAATGSRKADGALDQVIVNGTSGNDFITIANQNGAVTVNGLAAQVTIAHADGMLDQLTVNGGAGDDVIDASALAANQIMLMINGGAGNDVIFGSRGNDTVIGGQGNDITFMGAGNDRFIWNPGDGSDTVDGGDGFDTLVFNGSNVGENMTLSGGNGQATLNRDVGAVTMRLTSIEEVDIAALGGADNITINDLTGSGVKQVGIDLSAPAGSGTGDGAADTVTVNGTAGNDHIRVASNGASVVVSGLAAQVTINGAEHANDTLIINAQQGNDTIDASALQARQINLVLNGGSGNDTLIGSSGNDTLFGGFGADTFVFGGNFGHDTVSDFSVGTGNGANDFVQFDRSIFSNFTDVLQHAQQIGNDTTITVDPNRSVTLQNVALSSLTANDFRFA